MDNELTGLAERLAGRWDVSGDLKGVVWYELQEGERFLIQSVDLDHMGRRIKGIEVIGRLKGLDGVESEQIRARFFSFLDGLTLDYVYEMEGDVLTIWGGERESSAFFRGIFSEGGAVLTGGWQWPEGGYKTVARRAR